MHVCLSCQLFISAGYFWNSSNKWVKDKNGQVLMLQMGAIRKDVGSVKTLKKLVYFHPKFCSLGIPHCCHTWYVRRLTVCLVLWYVGEAKEGRRSRGRGRRDRRKGRRDRRRGRRSGRREGGVEGGGEGWGPTHFNQLLQRKPESIDYCESLCKDS